MGNTSRNEINPGKRLTYLLIWQYAKKNNYSILTFDEDFNELQNLLDFPPKIIWLRTGNLTTAQITEMLLQLESEIVKFLNEENSGIYEIYL